MKTCNVCNQESPISAKFCIMCGSEYTGYTKETMRIDDIHSAEIRHIVSASGVPADMPYFIYKADLLELLQDTSTLALFGGEIYYKGRRVVFMD